jgi:outer membrane protein OmpA-like peptidoglycan-associated protein
LISLRDIRFGPLSAIAALPGLDMYIVQNMICSNMYGALLQTLWTQCRLTRSSMQMTNFPDRLSSDLPRRAMRPLAVQLAPILLAAALVGCATSAQHRSSGRLSSKVQAAQAPTASEPGYQPAPYEEPANPRQLADMSQIADKTGAAPQTLKDKGAGAGLEQRAARSDLLGGETAESQREGQAPGAQRFADQTGRGAEEMPFVRQPFVDDAPRGDEGTADNQRLAVDTPPAKDVATVAQQKSADHAPASREDDIAARHQFSDAATSVGDDRIAQQHFMHEPAAATTEKVTASEPVKDDGSSAAPEEQMRPPEAFVDDGKLAQTDEHKLPAATMLPMTITVEADPLFDFDRYAVQPESRRKLDDLVEQLKGVLYGEVISTGFADPIGTQMYNQILSQRRAEAVEQYLLDKGIPADKLKIEARGETEEYATYESCKGQGKRSLVACLQPDRRVEVTVTAGEKQ